MVAKSIAKMYTNIHKPTDYLLGILKLLTDTECPVAKQCSHKPVSGSSHRPPMCDQCPLPQKRVEMQH